MNTFLRYFAAFTGLVTLMISISRAQSPAPIIVQPANGVGATLSASKSAGAAAAETASVAAAIKLLEQIKAANDDVLSKQKAALEKLDEMQEAADQLQIFAKRG
jgi:hypothetical protein